MQPLILASSSPRRAQLLKQIGLSFEIIPSNLPEDVAGAGISPQEIVQELAMQKAKHIAEKIPNGLIIGADTIVVLEGKILGKPQGTEHALEMLTLLSGKEHLVYTGLALVKVPENKFVIDYSETKVKFRPFGRDEALSYIMTGEPEDKAGSYAIQGKGAVLVESITGCYFNVVGLPITKLVSMLGNFGVSIW